MTYSCVSYNTLSRNENIINESKDLKWGINSHSLKPDYSGYENQYNRFTFDEQIKFLNELNVDVLRFEIHADELGTWNEKDEDLEEFIKKLKESNIEPLVIIFTNLWRDRYAREIYDKPVESGEDWDFSYVIRLVEGQEDIKELQQLDIWNIYYERAFKAGEKLAENHGENIKYYNVGNEMARYLVSHFKIPNCSSEPPAWSEIRKCFNDNVGMGDDFMQYFHTEELGKRFISLAAYTKGFVDGIKKKDKSAKIVINDTEMYYGYIDFLNLLNVDFDIIGWNWYSGLGSIQENKQAINVYQKLVELSNGREIWITEFNSLLGNYYGELKQEINVESMIQEYVELDRIKSIIFYELIDQKYGQVETPYEDYFGLITAPFPNENNAQLKPAFDQYKYLIEEYKFGNQDYVFSLYTDIFKKSPNDMELNYWMEKLNEFRNKENLINEMRMENITDQIKINVDSKMQIDNYISNRFNEFLNRNPTKKELKAIRKVMVKSQLTFDLSIKILTSEEYWDNTIRDGYERRSFISQPSNR